ncbi:MAG: lysine exporter LysO family protein [Lautropia sp.]|nr:lysine exporter LysO family protein [Lautropia sp.]
MSALQALWPILAALAVGVVLGKILPGRMRRVSVRMITPLVWGLLFLIGCEFGEVISSAHSVQKVLVKAGSFALLTTIMSGLVLMLVGRQKTGRQGEGRDDDRQGANGGIRDRLRSSWLPIRECLIAIIMVLFGAAIFLAQDNGFIPNVVLPSSSSLLSLLVVLVGVDLTQVSLDWRSMSASAWRVPLSVVLGSLLGGVTASILWGDSVRVSLQLASGYGWFTLSSVMMGEYHGQLIGTVALMTDLFRELVAIILIYVFGREKPEMAIASAGATALDSTLPMVKQGCPVSHVPLALASGLILTVLAPVMIALFN